MTKTFCDLCLQEISGNGLKVRLEYDSPSGMTHRVECCMVCASLIENQIDRIVADSKVKHA